MRDRTDLGRRRARHVSWRRRHLNLRVCVALVAFGLAHRSGRGRDRCDGAVVTVNNWPARTGNEPGVGCKINGPPSQRTPCNAMGLGPGLRLKPGCAPRCCTGRARSADSPEAPTPRSSIRLAASSGSCGTKPASLASGASTSNSPRVMPLWGAQIAGWFSRAASRVRAVAKTKGDAIILATFRGGLEPQRGQRCVEPGRVLTPGVGAARARCGGRSPRCCEARAGASEALWPASGRDPALFRRTHVGYRPCGPLMHRGARECGSRPPVATHLLATAGGAF